MIPKSKSSFFLQAERGCVDAARNLEHNVTCDFIGPESTAEVVPERQATFIAELLANGTIFDGLAISVEKVDLVSPLIDQAVQAGIPVVTFDSDAPDSSRSLYVGTDNAFFGKQIAKVLKQLKPNGGTVGVISTGLANVKERENAFRKELLQNSNGVWKEVEKSPSNSGSDAEAVNDTEAFAQLDSTAIALMLESPMRTQQWEPLVQKYRENDIVYVSGDASVNQLDMLSRRKCHGLVGQLPYEMGYLSIQALYDLVQGETIEQEIVGINVVTHIMVPLVLPELVVDDNRIGQIAICGYILFALIVIEAIGFSYWTFHCRNLKVVKASQPLFLIMVAFGVLIMACTIIPLSFDDSTAKTDSTGICMSVPWLYSTGFTITFAALYSKTRRINHIFHSGETFARVEVKPHHVLIPFLVLLSLSTIVLLCWTVLDPLTYVRVNHAGVDGWNRVISTYGTCRSNHGLRFFVPLVILNVIVLIIANWQAYQARTIKSEFSESKYIGLSIASMLQCGALAVPILFLVRDNPEAFYLVVVFAIFIVSEGVLLLIFVPKIVLQDTYSHSAPEEQRRMILGAVSSSRAPLSQDSGASAAPRARSRQSELTTLPDSEESNDTND